MPSLREELEDARAKVRRQIEVQRSSSPYDAGPTNVDRRRAVVAELEAELAELEGALGRLGPP